MKKLLVLLSFVPCFSLLSACGGGGGGSDPAPQPSNSAPVADAGPDQSAQEGHTVTLNGSDSSDPDDDSLNYSWSQTSGTTVSLSDNASAQPEFVAPDLGGAEMETLSFELTVDDGDLDSAVDSVAVSVSAPTKVAFDPLGSGGMPFPNNWFFEGGDGERLNLPGDAFVQQLNLLDGFSTINPLRIEFDQKIDGDSLSAGDNVRVFEATIDSTTREVLAIEDELEAGLDYIVEMSNLPEAIDSSVPNNKRVLIKPLVPFKPSSGDGDATGYVVVVTNGIRDVHGFPVQTSEAFDAVRGSDNLSGGDLAALEALRQQTVGWTELLKQFAPMPALDMDDAVVSFSFTTVSTTDSLEAVAAGATAQSIYNIDDSAMGAGGVDNADVYSATITVPNYIDVGDPSDPDDSGTGLWLDSDGNRVTRYNPMPVEQDILVGKGFYAALPTGCSKPEDGWPVVIFDGGGGNSPVALVANFSANNGADTDLSNIATELAAHCLASISLERAQAAGSLSGPQGVDVRRQAAANLIHLVKTLPEMDLDEDGDTDFDGEQISFIGQSAGANMGILLTAVEPAIRATVVAGPDAGLAKAIDGSPQRGPALESNLPAGSRQGSATYELILGVIQGTNDPFDPLNYLSKIRPDQAFHLIEIYGDGELPGDIGTGLGSGYTDEDGNFLNPGDLAQPATVMNEGFNVGEVVETAPLAGVESIARVLGLSTVTSTVDNRPDGDPIRSIVRFTRGHHASGYVEELLGFGTIGVSEEWRNQQAEFVANDGRYLPVNTSPQAYVMQSEP